MQGLTIHTCRSICRKFTKKTNCRKPVVAADSALYHPVGRGPRFSSHAASPTPTPVSDPLQRRHSSTSSTSCVHQLEYARPYSEVPGDADLPVVGNLFEVARNHSRIHEFLWEQHERLGPIFKKKMGATEMVFITDLPAIEQLYRQEGRCPDRMNIPAWVDYRREAGHADGIVIATGEDWLRMRRAVNPPALRTKNVERYVGGMNDVTSDFVALLHRQRQWDNLVPDLEAKLFRWSLEMICSVMFSQRMGCVSDNPSSETKEFIHSMQDILATTQRIMFFPPGLVKLVMPSLWKRLASGFDKMFEVATKFVDAKLEEIEQKGIEEDSPGFIEHLVSHGVLSRKEIYSNIAEMMGGAVDTTANAVALLLHEVARHPRVQQKLYEESCQVPPNRLPTSEDLQNMPYLKAVIKETLRLYPTGNYVNRCLTEDAVIHGYFIPAKTQVAISMYVLGRQEKLYPDANSFHPERWLRDRSCITARANSYAFLPFGHGKRMCAGRRIADMEMQLLLHQLIRRFQMVPTVDAPMKLKSQILLTARDRVRIKLVDRQEAV